jgi:hypothetical protein
MMNNWKIIITCAIITFFASCVQPSRTVIVKVQLNTVGIDSVYSAGVRGELPLNWDVDMPLTPIVKDSLYEGLFSVTTGYAFTEIKFVVNGQFESFDGNRKVVFSNQDTTVYKTIYNLHN